MLRGRLAPLATPAAIAAAALALCGLVGLAAGHPAWPVATAAFLVGVGLAVARWRRAAWEIPVHVIALALLALTAALAGPAGWWAGLVAAATGAGTVWAALRRHGARLAWTESQREEVATQLDRRISELFSLQELSYVLSESIQIDRIVEQVVRYAARFLQASGALVVLREGEGDVLRVVGAEGSLAALLDQTTELGADALVTHAIERDRIEVAQGVAVPSVELLGGLVVRSAAVAPLRAHGVTMGALAVVDRREGPFTTEDLWLLSTVATQASVVLANGRLFEMVRRSKEEWETAFNALAEGVVVVGPTGAISRANVALARLVEAEGEEALIGCDLGEVLFGDPEPVHEHIASARRGERPAPLLLRIEESRRTLRLTAAPIAEPDAEASVVLLVEDVTEQRAMEAQLIQNEKMAAIGQLVSGVAHELNNPLTSIAGLTELLLERGPMAEAPREHLRVIHDQAERAGRIVRNLLVFARKGAPEKEPVDLNEVVARTSLLFVYELKLRGIELETRTSREPVHVFGDRYELQQVLLNLVTNAAQAVSELPGDRPRAITVETDRQGDQALLTVRDTGSGVPATLVPYLFTPFFTTKGPGHGTGLGLSLSYGIVDAHGGRLSYAQAPGGGAEFTITLPVIEHEAPLEPAAAESAAAAAALEAAPRGRRILVVDDDPAVHRVVSALFTPDGHSVEVMRNGRNALGLLEDAPYDLVVADAAAAAGDELFVTTFLARHPEWRDRLVVATHGRGAGALDPFPGESLHRLAKPFNLRELRGLAAEIFGRLAA
ncbi:MAG TPA: ATP-binding protein [Gemmatimonadales bacterium]|nr:ATP-binding protein [Gemmatimonadales bacterium]